MITANPPDFSTWPDALRALAEIIGPERALELARTRGGVDIYIPYKATPKHPWGRFLTADEWERVRKAFGGTRFTLPRGTNVRLRKRLVFELAEQGLSHGQIAIQAGVTARYVRRLINGGKV